MGQISPDGHWYWDGQHWLPTLSADGGWSWDGRSWIPTGKSSNAARPDSLLGLIQRVPGFRTGTGWKTAVVAIGLLGMLAAIPSLTSSGGSQTALVQQSSSSPTPPAEQLASPSPTHSAKPSPSSSPPPSPSASPPPVDAPQPPAPPPPPPPQNTCGAPANPWGYNFCGGNLIYSPPGNFCQYFNCIASFWKYTNGYVDECNDGTYSHSGGRQGACSYHHGEMRPLYGP